MDETDLPLRGSWGSIVLAAPTRRHVVHVRGDAALLGTTMLRATALGTGHALKLGPDDWLLIDAEPPSIAAAGSVVDIGARQIGLIVEGPGARDVLAAGCPLDTADAAFPVAMATRTIFGKAEIILWRTGDDAWRIEVWRSFADYAVRLLRRAAADAAC